MIRVLHIYPQGDAQCARYIHLLTNVLADKVESALTCEAAEAAKLCSQWKPDIVHQHGDVAVPAGHRVVITLHGASPRCDGVYAIVSRSQLEANRMKVPRMELVRNPLITKTTDAEEMGRKMMRIYQKVMDSNVYALMNDATRSAISSLLKVAICGDKRWLGTPIDAPQVNWRQLYIYAELENVLPLIEKGIALMGLHAPQRQSTESYLPATYTKPNVDGLSTVVDMLKEIEENGPTLLLLTTMMRELYNPELDEKSLLDSVVSEKLKPLLSSVLSVVSHWLLIDEGFMPCPPANDHQANRLNEQIVNHLKI